MSFRTGKRKIKEGQLRAGDGKEGAAPGKSHVLGKELPERNHAGEFQRTPSG